MWRTISRFQPLSRSLRFNQLTVRCLSSENKKIIDLSEIDKLHEKNSIESSNPSSFNDSETSFDKLYSELIDDLMDLKDPVAHNLDNINQVITATDLGHWSWWLPAHFYKLIDYLHTTESFSWVSSIAISCVLMRTFTFPLYVATKRKAVILLEDSIKAQKKMMNFQLKDNKAVSLEELAAKQQEITDTMLGNFGSFGSTLTLNLVSGIIFSSFYFSLKAMANYPIPSLQAESFLWVPSLCQPDPIFLFPLLTSTSLFLMLRYNMESTSMENKKISRIINIGLPLIILLITSQMPANIAFYWFLNNNITVLFFFLTRHPKIKGFLGIPEQTEKPISVEEMNLAKSNFQRTMNRLHDMQVLKERKELEEKAKYSVEAQQSLRRMQDDLDKQKKVLEDMRKVVEELKKRK